MYLGRICEIRFDDDGCTRLPVYSWIKIVGTGAGVCRHTSQTVTLFMHALNLIVTSTTHSPPPPLSVSLPCWLHSLCNHVLSPSDEKLITIHSYQREPSPHCWHRLDCCVCTLLLRTHTWIDKTVWCFLSRGYERDYHLDDRGGVSCCLIIYFNIIKQICLSDSADEGKIIALSFIEETVSKHLHHLCWPNSLKQKILWIYC